MISREELDLIIAGVIAQAAKAIEGVGRLRLTSTEAERMGAEIATGMRLVADRCVARLPAIPPPAPGAKPPRVFQPALTQELRRVTDEDIAKARK
jgi:hypothetical protein